MSETGTILHEPARSHPRIGAAAPGARRLAAAVAAPVPETGDPVVVEIGPGAGATTAVVQELLGGRGRHLVVTADPRLAGRLRGRFPSVDVATEDMGLPTALPALLAERGLGGADVVISGRPWAVFRRASQHETLHAVRQVLAPEGVFIAFGHVHSMRLAPALRLRRMLGAGFEEVVAGRTVWGTLPPAFVYHCRRPRTLVPLPPAGPAPVPYDRSVYGVARLGQLLAHGFDGRAQAPVCRGVSRRGTRY